MTRRVGCDDNVDLTLLLRCHHHDSNHLWCTSFLAVVLLSLIAVTPAFGQPFAAENAENLAAEMTRFPPVEPADAPATFTIQRGYSLELVASEPLVSDPVDACFDARGRMFIAEMHGYPYSAEVRKQQPQPLGKREAGIIRLLEDTDGDGRYDRSVIFAERISWPTSVCCHDGGLFVLAPSQLLYLKDTDGDDVADVRRIVLSGFPRANVQGLANNMTWGLDNRITFAAGTNGGELFRSGESLGGLRGSDVAFDPRSGQIELLTGGRQFGMSLDDWGNRFVCSNSNHIQHVVFERADLDSNPSLRVRDPIRSIAAEGAAAPVFRKSPPEPWRIVRTRRRAADPAYRKRLPPTELVPIGFFTSATGVTIYRGDAAAELHGQAFIGDVGGNLVHRKTLTPQGASFVAKRADEGVEFISSTDTWFRPVNFVNAPDGCLYILDMYRETIEHPASIPEDIKEHVDLQSGHDRGRIWRLVPPGWEYRPPARLDALSSTGLVKQLDSSNAWNRETAQRLIVDRRDTSVADGLRQAAKSSNSPQGRLHALATLQGLGLAESTDFAVLIAASDPRNRAAALRLWRNSVDGREARASFEGAMRTALERAADDDDTRVRFELALSLRVLDEASRLRFWQRLAAAERLPTDLRTALLLAATSGRDQLVDQLASSSHAASGDEQSLMLELTELIGLDRDPREAIRLLTGFRGNRYSQHVRQDLLSRLGRGLRQRSSSLTALLASEELTDDVREAAADVVQSAAALAATESVSVIDRERAIGLLAQAPFDTAGPALSALLTPQTSQRLQAAAVAALNQHSGTVSGDVLLEHWPAMSPKIRKAALDALLSQTRRTELLLSAIGDGRVRVGDLEPADRELLLNHPRQAIQRRAEKVLGQPMSADRVGVITEYSPALSEEPDLTQGRAVFKKVCAACHRLGEEGHVVGPDLTSVSNKSAEDLLIALLDPNREAQPSYASYTILTTDGRVVTGLIAAETSESITLRRAEAKEETIRREDIEVMKANGVSLMPAGLEKDLTPRQLADVIGLVRSLGRAAP